MKARNAMDSDGSGACTQGSCTTYLYLANTDRWAMGQKFERVWSSIEKKGEPISGFPLKLFW